MSSLGGAGSPCPRRRYWRRIGGDAPSGRPRGFPDVHPWWKRCGARGFEQKPCHCRPAWQRARSASDSRPAADVPPAQGRVQGRAALCGALYRHRCNARGFCLHHIGAFLDGDFSSPQRRAGPRPDRAGSGAAMRAAFRPDHDELSRLRRQNSGRRNSGKDALAARLSGSGRGARAADGRGCGSPEPSPDALHRTRLGDFGVPLGRRPGARRGTHRSSFLACRISFPWTLSRARARLQRGARHSSRQRKQRCRKPSILSRRASCRPLRTTDHAAQHFLRSGPRRDR